MDKKYWYLVVIVGEGVAYTENQQSFLGNDNFCVTKKDLESLEKNSGLINPMAFTVSYLGHMTENDFLNNKNLPKEQGE